MTVDGSLYHTGVYIFNHATTKLITHTCIFCNTTAKNSNDTRGCTWFKKRIERTAKHLFLGAEDRGLQFLNSVKNEAKNVYLV